MDNQPWIEKYRPDNLDNIIHHTDIVNTLKNLINNDKLPHMIFFGNPGTGKTSTIIACAKQIYGKNYNSMVLELNSSNDRGIGVIRNKVKEFSQYNQLFCKGIKLVILDEADSMTYDAQFALRRVIENYTYNTRFCLICNYITKIIDSLQSRCIIFRFSNIDKNILKDRLKEILKSEKVRFTEEGLELILKLSNGDMRQSLNLLHSISLATKRITKKNIYKYTLAISDEMINSILEEVSTNNYQTAYKNIKNLINKNGLYLHDLINNFKRFIKKMNLNNIQLCEFIKDLKDIEMNLLNECSINIQLGAFIASFYKVKYVK